MQCGKHVCSEMFTVSVENDSFGFNPSTRKQKLVDN